MYSFCFARLPCPSVEPDRSVRRVSIIGEDFRKFSWPTTEGGLGGGEDVYVHVSCPSRGEDVYLHAYAYAYVDEGICCVNVNVRVLVHVHVSYPSIASVASLYTQRSVAGNWYRNDGR
jgi:hypothetical protein